MRTFLLITVGGLLCSLPSAAQQPPPSRLLSPAPLTSLQYTENSPYLIQPAAPSGGYLLSQAVIGAVTGGGGAVLGGMLGVVVERPFCGNDDWLCGLGGLVIGGSIGLVTGSALGVYSVSTRDNWTGSRTSTFVGSMLGFAGTVGLLGIADGQAVLVVAAFTLPVWGAIIGFNRSRRRTADDPTAASLLTWRGATPTLSIPAIAPVPDPLTRGRTMAWRVPFVSARW